MKTLLSELERLCLILQNINTGNHDPNDLKKRKAKVEDKVTEFTYHSKH